MNSIRKWLNKPKKGDQSLLAQYFYADEELNTVAAELDSFDGRKDPDRCTALVNHLRQCQDKVLSIIQMIMDEVIPEDRASRDFRAKFPDDVLQENLAGQLWFGAECLSAGSNILNRELESSSMRPLAKALTKSLENVRNLLREQCFRSPPEFTEKICESLKILDRLFAEFELSYVSAMVPVKSVLEYEAQQAITVLFSETLQRSLKLGLLCQDQVDSCDPALMFTIPRLAIVSGLLIFPSGPLCLDRGDLSDMFRPFRSLLLKIRELLWTLNRSELGALERALCSVSESFMEPSGLVDPHGSKEIVLNNRNSCVDPTATRNHHNSSSHHHFHHNLHQSNDQISTVSSDSTDPITIASHSIQDYLDQFCKDFPQCKDFISDICHSNSSSSPTTNAPILEHEEDTLTFDHGSLTSTKDNRGISSMDNNSNNEVGSVSTATHSLQYSSLIDNGLSVPVTNGNCEVQNQMSISTHSKDDVLLLAAAFATDCASPTTSTSSSLPSSSPKLKSKAKSFYESFKNETEQLAAVRVMENHNDEWDNVEVDETEWLKICDGEEVSREEDEVLVLEEVKQPASSSPSRDSGLSDMAEPESSKLDLNSSNTDSEMSSLLEEQRPTTTTNPQVVVESVEGQIEMPTEKSHGEIFSTDLNLLQPVASTKGTCWEGCSNDCCSSTGGSSTCETSSCDSECQGDMEIALAMQAAEIASRNEVRARFKNSSDLIHRLFICISGVADQLQTNYAADLRSTLKCVFAINATPSEFEEESGSLDGSCGENSGLDVTPEPSLDEENSQSVEGVSYSSSNSHGHGGHLMSQEPSGEHSVVLAPPTWVPDELAPQCMACSASFTVVRRRHHCRNCGRIFCGKCSNNSVPLPRYGHLKPVRVCNRCFMYSVTPFTLPAPSDS